MIRLHEAASHSASQRRSAASSKLLRAGRSVVVFQQGQIGGQNIVLFHRYLLPFGLETCEKFRILPSAGLDIVPGEKRVLTGSDGLEIELSVLVRGCGSVELLLLTFFRSGSENHHGSLRGGLLFCCHLPADLTACRTQD